MRPRLLMDFTLPCVRILPGVNSRAELVTLARARGLLITSGKRGKSPNAHMHKKYSYKLIKYKMVTKVQVKPNIFK